MKVSDCCRRRKVWYDETNAHFPPEYFSSSSSSSFLLVVSHQDVLRKYILYARGSTRPNLTNIDQDKIARLYADLRRESMSGGGVPIAVRHIESVMRMSEAVARMNLRDHVRDDDVARARLLASPFHP